MNYFTLQVVGGKVPDFMAYQAHKGTVYLSPHTKLSDMDRAAYLDTEDLARRAAVAIGPIMKKRHGDGARIEVLPVGGGGGGASADARIMKKIKADSAMMEARTAQRIFAPNKQPKLPASS